MRWEGYAGVLRSALLLLAAAAAPAAAAPADCSIPEDLSRVDHKLPVLRAALQAKKPVRIVAIGGGSTAGAAAGSADLAYPHRLQERLAEMFPSVPIAVVNKGVQRQSAKEMLQRFDADVFAEHPVLVIWEAGTHEAVRGMDADDLALVLQHGVGKLRAHGIDIVLIDMQFSRTTESLIDFEIYLRTMHRVGEVNEVYVFPRYAIMRYWSEQHVFNFDVVDDKDRAKLAADVYRCLGGKLADAIRAMVQ